MADVLNQFPAPLGPLTGLRTIRLRAGDDYAQAIDSRSQVWAQALEGHVHVCGHELHAGQGVLIGNESVLAGYAQADSLLLVIELSLSHSPAEA